MLITESKLRKVIRSVIIESVEKDTGDEYLEIRGYEIQNSYTSLGDDAERVVSHCDIEWFRRPWDNSKGSVALKELIEDIRELYSSYDDLFDRFPGRYSKKLDLIKSDELKREIKGEDLIDGWDGDYVFFGVEDHDRGLKNGYYVNLDDLSKFNLDDLSKVLNSFGLIGVNKYSK